jgi:hypothetical protein
MQQQLNDVQQDERKFTIKEAAEQLGLTPGTVRNYIITKRTLPDHRPNGQGDLWLYQRDIDKYKTQQSKRTSLPASPTTEPHLTPVPPVQSETKKSRNIELEDSLRQRRQVENFCVENIDGIRNVENVGRAFVWNITVQTMHGTEHYYLVPYKSTFLKFRID